MSVEIVEGAYKQFVIILSLESEQRFDLTGFDLFTVCLPGKTAEIEITEVANANGSVVALNGSADKGEVLVTLYADDSLLLGIGRDQNIHFQIGITGTPEQSRRFVLSKMLTVIDYDC